MDVLKQQLARIQQQLGKLSASQKMLTASLLAIMVLTLMYWARYAGTPELEPLLAQSLSGDELVRIRAKLQGAGVPFTVEGDRILVSTERKFEAIALLSYDSLLPGDTSNAFQDIVKQLNPLAPPSTTDRMWNVGYQNALEQIIRRYPGVRDAKVIISPISERRLGQSIEPSASVAVFLRPNEKPSKKLANTIADLVAGAHAALNRARVAVTINDQSFTIADRSTSNVAGGSEMGELERAAEASFRQKVEEILVGYGQVNASVRVKLDNESEKTTEEKVTSVTKSEKQNSSTNSESSAPGTGASEPGAMSNAALSVDSGPTKAVAGTNTNTTKEDTTFENFPSRATTQREKQAGHAEPVSVAVSVPNSYFANLLKARGGANAKDPEQQAIDDFFQKEHRSRIVQLVKAALSIKDENLIVVDTYMDSPMMLAAVGTDGSSNSAGGGGIVGSVGGYAKEIAIGILALMSLVMVSMMVKKSTPIPIVTAAPAVPEVEESVTISNDEAIAGEVAESDQALDGMELDSSAVKAQQMIEQVSTMVKENPDGAANLVKRWLNRS
jgi:flagellar biosynthesis/type III secretory pathway M-ring protein FliF/YscJ